MVMVTVTVLVLSTTSPPSLRLYVYLLSLKASCPVLKNLKKMFERGKKKKKILIFFLKKSRKKARLLLTSHESQKLFSERIVRDSKKNERCVYLTATRNEREKKSGA